MTIPMQWALRRRMMAALNGGVDVANLLIQGSCTFTDYGVVTMGNGNDYRLLAITQSGNLAIFEPDGISTCPVNCEVCVVGGGANGSRAGGAGGYLQNQVIANYSGGAIIVGAAQGVSSIGDISVAAVSGKNGGTGGGSAGTLKYHYSSTTGTTYSSETQYPGTGDGLSKYPFQDETYSLWSGKPHCAGGGGGYESGYDEFQETTKNQAGGNGGSNGSNGLTGEYGSSAYGQGGIYGGGNANSYKADNATYYGSGGGGIPDRHYQETHTPGSGYQGIVYVRIPINQSLLAA